MKTPPDCIYKTIMANLNVDSMVLGREKLIEKNCEELDFRRSLSLRMAIDDLRRGEGPA